MMLYLPLGKLLHDYCMIVRGSRFLRPCVKGNVIVSLIVLASWTSIRIHDLILHDWRRIYADGTYKRFLSLE